MLHHISFGVVDIVRSARFYDAVLAPLGYVRVWEDIEAGHENAAVGYGSAGGGDKFALKLRPGRASAPGEGFHLAFAAPDRASVDRLFAAAMRHGGVDDGAPGLRPEYGPDYYAAFVVDPDGYRIEAVINREERNWSR
jgi:catechol 2,3-dioxygenase-like lactoylglutathione lyase family enzyme